MSKILKHPNSAKTIKFIMGIIERERQNIKASEERIKRLEDKIQKEVLK